MKKNVQKSLGAPVRKERKACVNDLKPKANKLLSFITNWRLAEKEKTIELGESIQKTFRTGKFPNIIRAFYKLPEFKELLKTMERGKLFDLVTNAPPDEEEALSVRIYNLQILIESFHRLVHIDYNKEKIKDPYVHVKVFAKNLLEYLECAHLLLLQEGPIVQEIHSSLFQSIQHFSIEIKKVITNNPDLFTPELVKLSVEPVFNYLSQIDTSTYSKTINEKWLKVMIELNIDPKLRSMETQSRSIGMRETQSRNIGQAVAHKLINQLQSLLEKKRQFYQQNPPYFTPTSLRDKILLELCDIEGEPLAEHFSQSHLDALFTEKKFSLLEAKETGFHKKIQHIQEQFWLYRESLFSLIDQYSPLLPPHFSSYLLLLKSYNLTHPTIHQSHHITQLELGFYSVQYDYLMELLTEATPSTDLPSSTIEKIYATIPYILWFLETYYHIKPLPPFLQIKKLLSQVLITTKISNLKETMQRIFFYLIPDESRSFDELEMHLAELTGKLQEIALPPSSIESNLLRERIRNLTQIDLPSHPQTWFVMGEVVGLFFILLAKFDPLFSTNIHAITRSLHQNTFLRILLLKT